MRGKRLTLLILAAWLLAVGLPATAHADNAGPVAMVRASPDILAWLTDPGSLLREQPIAMTAYDPTADKETEAGLAADCESLAAAQEAGHYPRTGRGMALESVASGLCALNARYRGATFEPVETLAITLDDQPLAKWSAWFQLAAIPNVADAIEAAVGQGVSLAAFAHPSTEGCGTYTEVERDAVSFTARNGCDESYVLLVGQEITATGHVRPIVFYVLSAIGGTLRAGSYATVDRHPVTGVWTPIEFLEE